MKIKKVEDTAFNRGGRRINIKGSYIHLIDQLMEILQDPILYKEIYLSSKSGNKSANKNETKYSAWQKIIAKKIIDDINYGTTNIFALLSKLFPPSLFIANEDDPEVDVHYSVEALRKIIKRVKAENQFTISEETMRLLELKEAEEKQLG